MKYNCHSIHNSFRCTTNWLDNSIHCSVLNTNSVVTICHHTAWLWCYWLYSPCCIFHLSDLVILWVGVCTCFPHSPNHLCSGNDHLSFIFKSLCFYLFAHFFISDCAYIFDYAAYNHGETSTSTLLTLDISREGVEKHHIKKEVENRNVEKGKAKCKTQVAFLLLWHWLFITYTVGQNTEREKERQGHKEFGIRLDYETFFKVVG